MQEWMDGDKKNAESPQHSTHSPRILERKEREEKRTLDRKRKRSREYEREREREEERILD